MPDEQGPGRKDERPAGDHDERAVYIISVAAELAGVHPQTLRIYERKGLVRPHRTVGNTRRYSDEDIRTLRMIQELTQDEGVNLAGVKLIMELQTEIERLRDQIAEVEARLAHRRAIAMSGRRIGADIVPLRSVVRQPWEDAR
ncbi:MAG: helix-turn-helix transcriptional regulator [Actinomycetota bacterium]|nr:helix-turn-helix transcriptional regulator [Actinomycetota bacterium]